MKNQVGDILSVPTGIILHQVNCMGVMGRGIAKSIRDKWPDVFTQYSKLCRGKRPGDLLGHFQLVQVEEDLYVGNVFGQCYYGLNRRHTDYEAVRTSLCDMRNQLFDQAIFDLPIYYPLMGCVNGGGDWRIMSEIIDTCLDGMDHTLVTLK